VLAGWTLLSHTDAPCGRDRCVPVRQVEGVAHVLRQATTAQTTPSLDSPAYAVLRAAREYEVRRYAPYAVAEVGMPAGGPASGAPGAARPRRAEAQTCDWM